VTLVFDEVQLRSINADELAGLQRALAALATRRRGRTAQYERRRTIALAVIATCCLALAAWTGLLAATLPHYYRAGGWRGAWVGFDIALLAVFTATGWAAWRRRQVLIICLVVLATLLCCDAWFDVMLDSHTKGFEVSLLSAVIIELPLALLAIAGARRLFRLTVGTVGRRAGYTGPVPPLWQIPLLGVGSDAQLRDLLPQRANGRPAGTAQPGVASGRSLPARMSSGRQQSSGDRAAVWLAAGPEFRIQRGGEVRALEDESRRDERPGDDPCAGE
jgi:hypothetical protein